MNTVKTKIIPSNKIVILDVAEQLFVEHGYRETTVADIASQAGMSAANLYRHYENKEDIAAACASRCIEKKITVMREVLHKGKKDTAGRLEEFIVALLHYTHEETQKRPRLNEIIGEVIHSRPEVLLAMLSDLQSMIAEILAQGNAQQEFVVENVVATAETVFASITIFCAPTFMHLYPLPEFERRARSMAKLLVHGLSRR